MNKEWKVLASTALTAIVMASALPIFGQQKPAPPGRPWAEGEKVFQERIGPPGPPPPGDTFVFVASEMSFDGKVVKGAPYSAQAVTESTQTLSDGNRIVNKSTTSIYRDSEGRTRRELTLRGVGIFAGGGEPPQTILINDPVAGVTYTLDSRSHVARKMPAFRFEFKTGMPPPGAAAGKVPEGQGVMIERTPPPGKVEGQAVTIERTPMPPPRGVVAAGEPADVITFSSVAGNGPAEFVYKREGGADKNVVTEKLGTQIIEGVAAEGSRTTFTIAAGEIGNERAISIVDERWYSPELKTVVMSRHSDPRTGETVYKLTNISREEPPRTLFEVPADYTIKDDPPGIMRRKLANPE